MSLRDGLLGETAADALNACRAKGLTAVTVESCTGGLICAALTSVAGSSDVVYGGFVTYANRAKTAMVGVDTALIEAHGAVSEEVARAMAEGGLKASGAALAVAVTGIAGPGGAVADKPVGTVHIVAQSESGAVLHELHHFQGDRGAVQEQTALTALQMLKDLAELA